MRIRCMNEDKCSEHCMRLNKTTDRTRMPAIMIGLNGQSNVQFQMSLHLIVLGIRFHRKYYFATMQRWKSWPPGSLVPFDRNVAARLASNLYFFPFESKSNDNEKFSIDLFCVYGHAQGKAIRHTHFTLQILYYYFSFSWPFKKPFQRVVVDEWNKLTRKRKIKETRRNHPLK